MKPRPRQVDQNKAFVCVDSVDKFLQVEGVETESQGAANIVTPDMLLSENTKQQVPVPPVQINGKKPEPQKIVAHYKTPEYNRYMLDPYPNGFKYELTEMDYRFLLDFNAKIKAKYNLKDVKEEDLEILFEELDKRSVKELNVEFSDYKRDIKEPLPTTIQSLDEMHQLELYNHWRKSREDLKRALLRANMHPDLDDPNPHLAFRCRVAPKDNTMKLRRGNQQQQKGLQDFDVLSMRVGSLKEELGHAENLLRMILVREKGIEVTRRQQFFQWYRQYKQEVNSQYTHCPHSLEFSNKCFQRDHTVQEDYFESIEKQAFCWKKEYEQVQREQEQSEDQCRKFLSNLQSISDSHRITIKNAGNSIPENDFGFIQRESRPPPRPRDPIPREKNPQNKEYIEERRESVAKLVATLYLEARKHHLTFEKVINNPSSLANFTPPIVQQKQVSQTSSAQNTVSQTLPQSQERENTINTHQEKVNKYPVPPRKQMSIEFIPMKRLKSNLILKVPLTSEWIQSYQHQKIDDFGNSIFQNVLFKRKREQILALSQIDGIINDGIDDDTHDEELLKTVRKKLKLNQTRSLVQQQGQSQIQVK